MLAVDALRVCVLSQNKNCCFVVYVYSVLCQASPRIVRSLTRRNAPFKVKTLLQHVEPVVHCPVVKLDQDVPPCGELVVG